MGSFGSAGTACFAAAAPAAEGDPPCSMAVTRFSTLVTLFSRPDRRFSVCAPMPGTDKRSDKIIIEGTAGRICK